MSLGGGGSVSWEKVETKIVDSGVGPNKPLTTCYLFKSRNCADVASAPSTAVSPDHDVSR